MKAKEIRYWMVKQEPETYSWDDLVRDKETDWSGVRNYQARNNLREMKVGDRLLFYHSGRAKEVVGVAEVVRKAYQDPTAKGDDRWVAVDIKPVKSLASPVPLTAIRYSKTLNNLPLLRQTQLSVMQLTKEEFMIITGMGNGKKKR
jgi:predicted RNA-binding protein with PUA-like domain